MIKINVNIVRIIFITLDCAIKLKRVEEKTLEPGKCKSETSFDLSIVTKYDYLKTRKTVACSCVYCALSAKRNFCKTVTIFT